MIGIYKITSPNNKIYIGQSVNVERRIFKYKKFKDCKNQFKLLNSFNKYGIENHIFEIVEECDIELLNERERYYQDLYNVIKKGLNCRLTTTIDKSGFLSQETKDKISKANKGRIYSIEVLENIRKLRKNFKHSEETKLKMSNLKNGDILVLSGSIPSSISNKIYKELSENVQSEVEIVLDTRGNLLQDNIHNNFLIKPNIHELRDMFGDKIETKMEIVEKCKYFLEKGVKNVILSRGGEGALLINENFVLEASVPKGSLINSIGAGDSMVAGFIAGHVKGLSVEDSFKLSVASGSATAYSYGLAEEKLVNKLYNEINIIKENY